MDPATVIAIIQGVSSLVGIVGQYVNRPGTPQEVQDAWSKLNADLAAANAAWGAAGRPNTP